MNFYSDLYISPLSLKRSDMARVQQGSHSFICYTKTRTIGKGKGKRGLV